MKTYSIVRFYQSEADSIGLPDNPHTVRSGLTLAEVTAHCTHRDSSSDTTTTTEGKQHTADRGPWFDGWTTDKPTPRHEQMRRFRENTTDRGPWFIGFTR